jgi:hypothetical protein
MTAQETSRLERQCSCSVEDTSIRSDLNASSFIVIAAGLSIVSTKSYDQQAKDLD